jgi:hypothetical protein
MRYRNKQKLVADGYKLVTNSGNIQLWMRVDRVHDETLINIVKYFPNTDTITSCSRIPPEFFDAVGIL